MSTSNHDDFLDEIIKENHELKLQVEKLKSDNQGLSDAMITVCKICHGLLDKNIKLEAHVAESIKEADHA